VLKLNLERYAPDAERCRQNGEWYEPNGSSCGPDGESDTVNAGLDRPNGESVPADAVGDRPDGSAAGQNRARIRVNGSSWRLNLAGFSMDEFARALEGEQSREDGVTRGPNAEPPRAGASLDRPEARRCSPKGSSHQPSRASSGSNPVSR
jgi:hypothetical protein